jgi:hypothetical protein
MGNDLFFFSSCIDTSQDPLCHRLNARHAVLGIRIESTVVIGRDRQSSVNVCLDVCLHVVKVVIAVESIVENLERLVKHFVANKSQTLPCFHVVLSIS